MNDPGSPADRRGSAWLLPLLALAAVFVIWTQVRAGGVPGIDHLAKSWAADHKRRVVFVKLNDVKDLGSASYVLPVLLFVGAVRSVMRSHVWPLLVAVFSVAGLALSVVVLKRLVARPGPSGVGPPAVEGAWPSGHATTFAVAMLVLVAVSTGAARRPLVVVAVVSWLLVSFALVYCGHHWLTDVAVAAPLGYLIVRAGTLGATFVAPLPAPPAPPRPGRPISLTPPTARPSTSSEPR